MSCEVLIHANVENLEEIQSYFGLGAISDKSWLNGVYIAIHCETLCFGYGSKLVINNSKYDKDLQQKVFGSSLKKVQLFDENELITSIVNISVSGGSNYVDWVCVIVGLSTGSCHFYSENGSILYEKKFHNESVLNIRMIGEEITIYYPSCIIVLQTTHLVPLLKSLREMYSKAKTSKVDLMDKDYMLAFKKWDYKSDDILISDAVMVPQHSTCLFDHLLSESLELGFTKKYRITPSQNASILSVGSKPFISYHSAREGFRQNVLTDVAKAVVNKITSRLPSWLTGSQPQQSIDNEGTENNSETLFPRHELIDNQRTGCKVYYSPSCYQLAAITDSLGRIILVDESGTMIRMWKGYREAQCGFMEVHETKNRKDQSSESRRSGLFLIVYAPRKAIIEIWCLEKGPKVATFQATSKNGILIYNNHDSATSQRSSSRKDANQKASCLFFDPDDNSLKSFSIPFHCILSETNSKSAEDFHFLKRLKMMLKNSPDLKDSNEVKNILEICERLQTPEIKLQCLKAITSNKKIQATIVESICDVFLVEGSESTEIEDDVQDKIYRDQLRASCINYKSLVNCYLLSTQVMEEEEPTKKETIELLGNDYLTMQKVLELMSYSKKKENSATTKNVSFKDTEACASIVQFLSSFAVVNSDVTVNLENSQSHHLIGSVLFSRAWKEEIQPSQLLAILESSKMNAEDLMTIFLHFYLQQDINFSDEDHVLSEMSKFKNILEQVCKLAEETVTYVYSSISSYWQKVREYLLCSENPINALLASIICKNYALNQYATRQQDEITGFDCVSQEECQWTLLTEKLNDVAMLSIFVTQFGNNNQYERPSLSLSKILNDGKGIISELVASKLVGSSLPIEHIFNAPAEEDSNEDEKNLIKKLNILRQHFPYSLNSSVILCYAIWDILSARWSKNLSEFQYLKTGIKYLNLFDKNDHHLKQGLCVMLWNANFKIPLKATQKLINKTGRLPKEKLCLQNTMIPDFLIPQFFEQALIFLEHFRDSINYDVKMEFRCEEILNQGSSSSSLSLCELILQQSKASSTLLDLHYEMVKVLELVSFLSIKIIRPLTSLFDEASNEAFFMEITKHFNFIKPEDIRQNTRLHFLKKAVSTSIDLIIECQGKIYFDDHFLWIEKIKKLAEIWKLDISVLDSHHVLELYVYGYDDLAGEFLGKLDSPQKIVKQLLDIAAKRLNLILEANKSGWSFVASGGPLLTNYLEAVHARKEDSLLANVKSSSNDQLYKLNYKIFQIASQKNFADSKALRLAGQILDVSLLLKDNE